MNEILKQIRKAKRAAFSTKEIAALDGRPNYVRLMLHRLHKKGEIKKIKNGWWAFSDSMSEAVACEVSKPAYVSFHSAMYLNELTTQIPGKIQLATLRKPKKYSIDGTKVIEYKIKKDSFNNFYLKDAVLLATKEKAFADCVGYPRSCPQMILLEVIDKIDLNIVEQLLISQSAKNRLTRLIRYAKSTRTE